MENCGPGENTFEIEGEDKQEKENECNKEERKEKKIKTLVYRRFSYQPTRYLPYTSSSFPLVLSLSIPLLLSSHPFPSLSAGGTSLSMQRDIPHLKAYYNSRRTLSPPPF